MALSDNYSATFSDLTEEERAEVGSFIVDLITAQTYSNQAKIASLISGALTDLSTDEDSVSLFCRTADYVEECGETFDKIAMAALMTVVAPMVKSASAAVQVDPHTGAPYTGMPGATSKAPMSHADKWRIGLSAAGLGIAAAPFIAHAVKERRRKSQIRNSFQQVLREHPHLQQDPHIHRYFHAVANFAPSVAANPLLAGNVLNSMHQIGPAAVTPRAIGELMSVDKDMSSRQGYGDHLSGVATGLQNAAKNISQLDQRRESATKGAKS